MSANNDELRKYFAENGDDRGSISIYRQLHGSDVEYEIEPTAGMDATGIDLTVWSGETYDFVTLPHVDSVALVEALIAILKGDE